MHIMTLKSQDVVILLKLLVHPTIHWTNRALATDLFMSTSEISGGLNRLKSVRLLHADGKKPIRRSSEEFLIHGVKYVYPPERGGLMRGMPTCYAAPPLNTLLVLPESDPPVWPDPAGTVRGYGFSPLYQTVPQAALRDDCLYEMLSLVDTLRDGRRRETELAIQELKKRL